jgi:hypothetical protein
MPALPAGAKSDLELSIERRMARWETTFIDAYGRDATDDDREHDAIYQGLLTQKRQAHADSKAALKAGTAALMHTSSFEMRVVQVDDGAGLGTRQSTRRQKSGWIYDKATKEWIWHDAEQTAAVAPVEQPKTDAAREKAHLRWQTAETSVTTSVA